jgi:hypothetical protein
MSPLSSSYGTRGSSALLQCLLVFGADLIASAATPGGDRFVEAANRLAAVRNAGDGVCHTLVQVRATRSICVRVQADRRIGQRDGI